MNEDEASSQQLTGKVCSCYCYDFLFLFFVIYSVESSRNVFILHNSRVLISTSLLFVSLNSQFCQRYYIVRISLYYYAFYPIFLMACFSAFSSSSTRVFQGGNPKPLRVILPFLFNTRTTPSLRAFFAPCFSALASSFLRKSNKTFTCDDIKDQERRNKLM